ncbi:MAG TPA: hypothetical protein VFE35_09480 [Candidatus Cybelea sp.]|jgi:hypothetical protein|nr:hypothetical protein [Candidatus Cybelea sp.]
MVAPPNAPPALTLVAQRYAETNRGVVTFRLHRIFDVHAGFSSRHEDLVLTGVYADGAIAKVRVVSYTIDGKPAGAAAQAALEQAYEHPSLTDAFDLPFDPRYFSAYQYQSAGPQKIAFTSSVRDAAHGNGTVSYDADGNVVSYTYQPNALPPHASFGEVTDRRSEVLPGYWAVIQETQQYKGSYGPFPGAGTVQITFSDFRRFPDLQSALRAIIGT